MSLTFKPSGDGKRVASLDGYYHGCDVTDYEAVRQLAIFLQREHKEVYEKNRNLLEAHLKHKDK